MVKTSKPGEPRLVALSGKVYWRLLSLYPAEYRREYREPMAQLFCDQCRDAWAEARGWGLAGLWLRVWFDLARSVMAEHLQSLRYGKSIVDKVLSPFRNLLTEKGELVRFARWLCSWRGIRTAVVPPVALVGVVYGVENWRGHRAWQQCQEELQSKGAVLDWSVLLSRQVTNEMDLAGLPILSQWFDRNTRASLGDDPVNRAWNLLYQQGFKSHPRTLTDLVSLQMALAAVTSADSNRAMKEFSLPKSSDADRAQAGREVLKHLALMEPLFEELRQAARQLPARWPVDWNRPGSVDTVHISPLLSVSRSLRLAVIAELAVGNSDGARQDLSLLLALADSLDREPIMFSHMMRCNVLRYGLHTLWEGIRFHQWTAPDLERFQERCANYNLLQAHALIMEGERAGMLKLAEFFHGKGRQLPFPPEDRWTVRLAKVRPQGWYHLEKVNLCRLYETLQTAGWDARSMRIYPDEVEEAHGHVRKLSSSPLVSFVKHQLYSMSLTPFFSHVIKVTAIAQTDLHQAVIACALERYWLAGGDYPETLDALIHAGLMKAVPSDLFTGEPMKYRRVSDQEYVLYSVGWNVADDGGQPGEKDYDMEKGDWRW